MATPKEKKPESAKEIKILLVDDGSLYTLSILDGLKRRGFKSIEMAINGRCSLDYLKCGHVDLIISSWKRREMSGAELLQLVKKHRAYENIPFIMLAHPGDWKTLENALRHGVHRFFPQPVDFEGLAQTILEIGYKNSAISS
jgi:response regulator RpfG family c-di-GMP phosphodiesterase